MINWIDESIEKGEKDDSLTIFVGGFGPFIVEDHLFNYFAKFGEVHSIILKRYSQQNINKGYAFVNCENEATVQNILANRHNIYGRLVDCAIAHSGKNKDKDLINSMTYRICAKGFPKEIKDLDLENYFNRFGKVKKAYVIYDQITKRSKLFGFVEFECEKAKNKALNFKDHILKKKQFICQPYIPKCYLDKYKYENNIIGPNTNNGCFINNMEQKFNNNHVVNSNYSNSAHLQNFSEEQSNFNLKNYNQSPSNYPIDLSYQNIEINCNNNNDNGLYAPGYLSENLSKNFYYENNPDQNQQNCNGEISS